MKHSKRQSTSQTTPEEMVRIVYEKANRVHQAHPELDRDTMVQTLFLLQKTPLERLNQSLMRATKSYVVR